MTNNERAVRFATECLRWDCEINPYDQTDVMRVLSRHDNGKGCMYQALPPFGEDTPEGWSAHKRWVEPWIEGKGLSWSYDEVATEIDAAPGGKFNLWVPRGPYAKERVGHANGPLPTAAIDTCLVLARKEKGDV